MVAIHLSVGAEAQHLIDESETGLEHVLRNDGSTFRNRGQSNSDGLKIRWKAWVRQRLVVHGGGAPIHTHAEAVDIVLNIGTGRR